MGRFNMASLGDIVIGLSMDNRQFTAGATSARGQLGMIASAATSVAGPLLALAGVGSAIGAIGFGVKLAADAEQSAIAFEVMLGSGDRAKSMLADIKNYADHSPFELAGAQEGAKKLLNYGIAASKVVPTMAMLGDVAAGDMNKFDALSTAFGQMSATGRLMGGDLNQFINAGFNPLQEIAKKTGESMGDLKKRMEAGGVSSQEVADAFKDATSEGGRFFGMTERQSQTLTGKFSTMKDGINDVLRTIGAELIEKLHVKEMVDFVGQILPLIPGYFRSAFDMAETYVRTMIGAWSSIFDILGSVANTALQSIGAAIGVHLDLTTVVAAVQDSIAAIPFAFRNAGSLIEIAVLEWQIALYEFVPGVGDVFGQIGSVIYATWEGTKAGFGSFVQNLTAGLMEIKNLAMAVWAAIKAGVSAIASGTNPLKAATDAFNQTLANQKGPDAGKNFAASFSDAYSKALKDSAQGLDEQGGLTGPLKSRKAELERGIANSESALAKSKESQLKPEDKPAEDDEESTGPESGDKGKHKKEGNKAALAGSSEAASIMLRGAFADPAKNQEKIMKAQLEEQRKTNAALARPKTVQIANF